MIEGRRSFRQLAARACHAARAGAHIVAALVASALLFVAPARADLPEAIARIKPSLVVVGTLQKTRSPAFRGMGTGFAVGDGTLIATNAHVVPALIEQDPPELLAVLVRSADGEWSARAVHKLALDPAHDLALLKLDGPPLPAVRLRSVDAPVREGQALAFTGFPIIGVLGPFPATNRGILSAITPIAIPGNAARELNARQIRQLARGSFDIYQLDATAYPGSSGSPVYDADTGEILGIMNMVLVRGTKEAALSNPSGISYAIPIRYLEDLLRASR